MFRVRKGLKEKSPETGRKGLKLELPGTRRKGSKPETLDNVEIIPEYEKRVYTTPELLGIFNDALLRDFSDAEAPFREDASSPSEKDLALNLMLLKTRMSSPENDEINPDISGMSFDLMLNPRVSRAVEREHIPDALATLIKRGFMNWEFLDAQDKNLHEIHSRFAKAFRNFYTTVIKRLEKAKPQDANVSEQILLMLDRSRYYKNPRTIYAAEMLLIDLMADLVVNGYADKAQVIYLMLKVCKKVIYSNYAEDEARRKTVKMISPSILSGLKLIDEIGLGVESCNFISACVNLTIKHPFIDEAFDVQLYVLYHQFKEKCANLGLKVDVHTHFLSREGNIALDKDLIMHYKDIAENFFPKVVEGQEQFTAFVDPKIRNDAVPNFFVHAVSRYCRFNEEHKARAIHNVLYVLAKMYQDDASRADITVKQRYAKMVRLLLGLPTLDKEVDALFDGVVVEYVFGDEQLKFFRKDCHVEDYHLSDTDTHQYARKLKHRIHELEEENRQLRNRNTLLEGLLNGAEHDRLLADQKLGELQHKFSELALEHDETSASVESPTGSPPILHRLSKKDKKAKSSEDLKPQLKESSRTKSESDLKWQKRRKFPFH